MPSQHHSKCSCLDVVIAVHDTGKQAGAELLYHSLQGLALSVPRRHDAVLCGRDTHCHRLPIIQLKLHDRNCNEQFPDVLMLPATAVQLKMHNITAVSSLSIQMLIATGCPSISSSCTTENVLNFFLCTCAPSHGLPVIQLELAQ